MGNFDSLTDRLKSERRDFTVQTSISAHDSDRLDRLVEWLLERDVQTNRSSIIRALIQEGLDAFDQAQRTRDENGVTSV